MCSDVTDGRFQQHVVCTACTGCDPIANVVQDFFARQEHMLQFDMVNDHVPFLPRNAQQRLMLFEEDDVARNLYAYGEI